MPLWAYNKVKGNKMNNYETSPLLAIDAYKLGHMTMYPEGTTKVYCNLTPRNFRLSKSIFPENTSFFDEQVVAVGMYATVKMIQDWFEVGFFKRDRTELATEFTEYVLPFLGGNSHELLLENVMKLYDLGHLPLEFKALPEGTLVPANVPIMTWTNTHDDFAWLPNYLETLISTESWKLITSATIARVYRRMFEHYAEITGVPKEVVDFQGHDFSARGLSGIADVAKTGMGHLVSFKGSDSVFSVSFINKYYKGKDSPLVAASVPATEHSVMCMGGKETEKETYQKLIKLYPEGIISIVSDTWDYWKMLTETLPEIKEEIEARQPNELGMNKLVIRPDSGDPVEVICGTDPKATVGDGEQRPAEAFGTVEILADTFGTTKTVKGYKELSNKIGVIYGDSITPARAEQILEGLKNKGFASSNIVLGIGSFTYQYVTRDTFGFAVKATAAVINGKTVKIFKEPKTDLKKKSAKGFMRVDKTEDGLVLVDDLDIDEGGELKVLFRDGQYPNGSPSLEEIRERVQNGI